jgi:hypothetical protein
MPMLKNPRWEAYASARVRGLAACHAYAEAGFKPNTSNYQRLEAMQEVQDRIAELTQERETVHAQATTQAIEKTGMDKAWVMEGLRKIIEVCIGAGPAAAAGATQALKLVGIENGMFIERRQQETTIVSDDRRTARERVAEIMGEEAATAPSGDVATGNGSVH